MCHPPGPIPSGLKQIRTSLKAPWKQTVGTGLARFRSKLRSARVAVSRYPVTFWFFPAAHVPSTRVAPRLVRAQFPIRVSGSSPAWASLVPPKTVVALPAEALKLPCQVLCCASGASERPTSKSRYRPGGHSYNVFEPNCSIRGQITEGPANCCRPQKGHTKWSVQ
jgi:hypothetical protein